jgi:hypothetical protein
MGHSIKETRTRVQGSVESARATRAVNCAPTALPITAAFNATDTVTRGELLTDTGGVVGTREDRKEGSEHWMALFGTVRGAATIRQSISVHYSCV